ncbi:hypothetical protein D3C72_1798360 [compost metagenome]
MQRPQRTSQQENRNPDAAHVIEGHGTGQRHLGDGIKPATHRGDTDQTAPCVHPWVGGFERHPLRSTQQPQRQHADQTAIENDFCGIEIGRGIFNAHPHGGEQKCAYHHP